MKYGLINSADKAALEETIDLIFRNTDSDVINITEVGIFDGDTARGIKAYVESKGKKVNYTCIDNNHDFEVKKPFDECNFILGNSNEVYNKIEDNSQHLIFIDALHTYSAVVSDFMCYSNKVKDGFFIAFHDTSPEIKPFTDYQRVGSEDDADQYIAVRKALTALNIEGNVLVNSRWYIVKDCFDPQDRAGGTTVYARIKI